MEKLPSLQQCPGMMLRLIPSCQKCSSGARWYNNTGRTAGRARTETRGAGWTVFPTAVQACCATLPGHDGRLHVRHSCVHIWFSGAAEICSARSRVECNSGETWAKWAAVLQQKQEAKKSRSCQINPHLNKPFSFSGVSLGEDVYISPAECKSIRQSSCPEKGVVWSQRSEESWRLAWLQIV